MGEKTFCVIMAALCAFVAPGVCLMWLFLINEINWHDALLVVALVVMQYQIRLMRREDRVAERAMRRVTARRFVRHEQSGLYDIPSFGEDDSLTAPL